MGEAPAIPSDTQFLVVEDNGFVRWTVGHHLRALGAEAISFAGDGQEALEIFRSADTPIDVIVTDLDMPGMDGIEFIRHIADARVPVSIIVLSGLAPTLLSSVSAMIESYGVSLLDVIEKPVTSARLGAAMRRYVRPVSANRALPKHTFQPSEVADALRRGELEPFFHPRIDVRTGALRGAEAVARWRHPTMGLMRRSSFMDAMLASGQAEAFGTAMLEATARASASWRAAGVSVPVSIHVPLASLTNVAVPVQFANIVNDSGLEPRDIVLQTVDATTSLQPGRVLEILVRLRMAGFGLSLDDYGATESSLKLAPIPFTELRIDRYFVRDALTDPQKKAVIEASIEVAGKLKVSTIAEGVDTRDQALLLHAMGCRLIQGHFVAKSMSADEFLHWAKSYDPAAWKQHLGLGAN
jgi:EAL domain-containing protein (putative c-di-GMP-specific phosphodiesterase class I)/ActR/RegA family two-component response regulator